jgi:ADP-heptose:LPS heptosyltransferase
VVGGPDDRALCAAVAEAMRHRAVVLAPGSGGMSGLTGLLAAAEIAVGNDTGPLHLAAAVGTATVGVYWGPNLVKAGPLRSDLHRAVGAWTPDCPVCGAPNVEQRCEHDPSFVAAAPLPDVLDHVDDLLSR